MSGGGIFRGDGLPMGLQTDFDCEWWLPGLADDVDLVARLAAGAFEYPW
jgi:hypothetical protein